MNRTFNQHNPVRPPCQVFSDLADGLGVAHITAQNKNPKQDGCPQITRFSAPDSTVSLRQPGFAGLDPVRRHLARSCQDYSEDSGRSALDIPILTGREAAIIAGQNPVRMEVAA